MADLAVIIVSFNSGQWLTRCLGSLYAHGGGVELDVVVVDNGSSDGSAELVEREFPSARVVRSENRGFSYGNNRGLAEVDAPFVLFLNPDTEVQEGTLAELVELMRRNGSVGLVGCRQVTAAGALIPTIRRFPTVMRYLFEALGSERFPIRRSWMGERELNPAAYYRETRCDWVSGSFMLARRDAVLEAGAMDERYFLYCEEPDLCARVKSAGWDVRYWPHMTIVHHEGSDGLDRRLEAQRAYARRQYMFKHDGIVTRNLSTLALALFYARRTFGLGADSPDPDAHRAAARAALLTLLGVAPPPFGELSGPRRGPRLASPELR